MSQLFELQVVLIPPSGRTPVFLDQLLQTQQNQFYFNPAYFPNSNMSFNGGMMQHPGFMNGMMSSMQNSNSNPSQSMTNGNTANSSAFVNAGDMYSNRSFQPQMFNSQPSSNYSEVVKFLMLINPSKTLLELSELIVVKCSKLYPNLTSPVIIQRLQDANQNDLDMEYKIRDVFRNGKNMVLCVLKNELDFNEEDDEFDESLTQFQLGMKRNDSVLGQSKQNIPSITIQKKRKNNLSTTMNSRISTPLVNELYTKNGSPVSTKKTENIDELLAADRSILPPPAPKSPPMRISSRIENKRIISAVNREDDTVSRSEQVDPDKSKRMFSETPLKNNHAASAVPASVLFNATPNKFTMTGQRVVSATNTVVKNNHKQLSNFAPESTNAKHTGFATPSVPNKYARSISGKLIIPEPKISEAEAQLKEGPSSPFNSVLPPKGDRIPMKKANGYVENSSSSASSSENEYDNGDQSDATMEKEESNISDEHVNGLPKSGSTESVNFTPLKQTSEESHNLSPSKNADSEESNKSVELAQLPPNNFKKSQSFNKTDPVVVDIENVQHKNFSEDSEISDSSDDEFENTIKKSNVSSQMEIDEVDNDEDMDLDNSVVLQKLSETKPASKAIVSQAPKRSLVGTQRTTRSKTARATSPSARLSDLNADPLKEDMKTIVSSTSSSKQAANSQVTEKENVPPKFSSMKVMGINSPMSSKPPAVIKPAPTAKNVVKKVEKDDDVSMTESSDSEDDSSSSEDEGTDDESDEDDDDEEEVISKQKPRRVVVNTPQGTVSRVPSARSKYESEFLNDLDDAPQSTQATQQPIAKLEPAVSFAIEKKKVSSPPSPAKTPVQAPTGTKSKLVSPPAASVAKARLNKAVSSLGSLHDLVSRGVPTVHEKSAPASKIPAMRATVVESSDDESSASNDSDEDSDEDESSDSDDSSSDDSDDDSSEDESSKKKFISAKTANKALRKNKKSNGNGFASLVKDSQKNKSTVL